MTHSIPFRGFDPDGDGRIYEHGILPHWRQCGCTYFVTFRQADSLPVNVLREMEQERRQWLKRYEIDSEALSWKQDLAKLPTETRREYEQMIGVTLDKHLNKGHGTSVLRHREIGQIVSDALNYFHETKVYTGDFVIMPNHVHVLLRPLPGFELKDVLHSVKSFTANKINKQINSSGEFWQRQSYDHIVRDFEQLEAFQRYITQNPTKANLNNDHFIQQTANWHATTTLQSKLVNGGWKPPPQLKGSHDD